MSLSEEEKQQITSAARPTVGTIIGASLVAGALALGGGAALANMNTDVPERSDFNVTDPQGTTDGVRSEVHDPGEVLSAEDEQRLEQGTKDISIPSTVQQVHYLVFPDNDDNVNDTVENYLRDHEPDLINDDAFAEGMLFVGVGLDPRQAFLFAGNDVADLLDLREGTHLDNSLEAIKPDVENGDIPSGLLAGTTAATDLQQVANARFDDAEGDRTATIAASGGGAGAVGLGGVLTLTSLRRRKSRKVLTARAEMSLINREYGGLAQRLDAIDIRAHSLSSDFVNDSLRSEWEAVRDRFLNMHDRVSSLGNLTEQSTDRQYLENAERISNTATTTLEVSHAENNIDKIYRVEHGDQRTRTHELRDIRDDIVEAQVSLEDSNSGLYVELQRVRDTTEYLIDHTADPNFLDSFTQLLSDYRIVLDRLREQKLNDLDDSKNTALTAPGITSPDYRVGYGVNNFVPFWALNSWYITNSEAQSSNSSSGTNTGFSSGFSGAGGSSSF